MQEFEVVLKSYEPMIFKIMRSLGIYREKEEYYQVGVIALWEAWERYDEGLGKPFISYAYACVRGKLLNELKRSINYAERWVVAEEEFWLLVVGDETSDDSTVELEFLRVCRGCLTEKQFKWVWYTLMYDHSIREIAIKEGVSISAVKQWREGARKSLRKKMGREGTRH
ncbi:MULTISPECIES: sigma-70 family RNA polymerase sigma factor [Cytobacillus]|uniref:sigma-70 family RNA polymerase sigma factor n=1 Tax=Cytobacillus TaxID=2675230 RepID=UPI00203D3D0B|nr:sigma-70 family RNA polymerase sigma factor [Cytobacillus kochii]MCM3322732.1 sigma-70 family RNA polymerase sigma factor [Cytobacillus kochii]MCM3344789.1 sigma-70 family RNA polymerase sigma factor [Cytobacillus kochii]